MVKNATPCFAKTHLELTTELVQGLAPQALLLLVPRLELRVLRLLVPELLVERRAHLVDAAGAKTRMAPFMSRSPRRRPPV